MDYDQKVSPLRMDSEVEEQLSASQILSRDLTAMSTRHALRLNAGMPALKR